MSKLTRRLLLSNSGLSLIVTNRRSYADQPPPQTNEAPPPPPPTEGAVSGAVLSEMNPSISNQPLPSNLQTGLMYREQHDFNQDPETGLESSNLPSKFVTTTINGMAKLLDDGDRGILNRTASVYNVIKSIDFTSRDYLQEALKASMKIGVDFSANQISGVLIGGAITSSATALAVEGSIIGFAIAGPIGSVVGYYGGLAAPSLAGYAATSLLGWTMENAIERIQRANEGQNPNWLKTTDVNALLNLYHTPNADDFNHMSGPVFETERLR